MYNIVGTMLHFLFCVSFFIRMELPLKWNYSYARESNKNVICYFEI